MERLKIIKDTSLGTLKWDNKMTGVGSSTSDRSSGDWIDAQLMYFLNPDDIATNVGLKTGYSFDGTLVKDANNTVIYELGKIPAEVVNGATTYNGMKNDWRVSTDALTKVDSVTYYLGGRGWDDTTHYGTAKDMYEWERGTTTYKDSRATNWSGKVGLIYPSDYGYTFAKGIDDTCYNDSYNCRNNTAKKSWIFNDKSQWTLESYIGYGYCVFYIRGDGFFSNNFANDSDKVVRPVVYLKPTIKLGGLGTEQDPYTIIS